MLQMGTSTGVAITRSHSRLRETIESRDVPREVIDEVDNVIAEIREIELNKIADVSDDENATDEGLTYLVT